MGKYAWRRICIFASALSALLLCACGKDAEKDAEKTVVKTDVVSAQNVQTDIKGDWYGLWKLENASGGWSGHNTNWWDCCARISEKEGELELCLWDEYSSREQNMADFTALCIQDGIECTGAALFDTRLSETECVIKLTEDSDGKLLTVSGHYYDDASEDSFDFCVYLRPWGDKWSKDAPFYYETWYLPLIEAGCPMPDKIDTDNG